MKVVIPAAGLGLRFLPATKSQPKEMLPVVDRPIIQYVVEEAVASGADDILIVTGRAKRSIEDHFDVNPELSRWTSTPGLRPLEELGLIGRHPLRTPGRAARTGGRHRARPPAHRQRAVRRPARGHDQRV